MIIEEIAKLLLWLIADVILVGTGEVIRFVASLGRHRPRWDLYTRESSTRFVLFSEASFWLGAAFWVVVIAVGFRLFSGS